jgi:hypothetical protein
MENASDPMPVLRSLRGSHESRRLLLATLTEASEFWRQNGSLAAYQVIFAALDSNDDEVRQLAEESLGRSSPRPAKQRTRSGKGFQRSLMVERSQRDGKSS